MAEIPENRKRELLANAAAWWDKRGRRLIRKDFNIERKDKVSTSKTAPGIVVRGTPQPVLMSGILNGNPWETLTRQERAQVLEAYLHNFTEYKSPGLEKREKSLLVPSKAVH